MDNFDDPNEREFTGRGVKRMLLRNPSRGVAVVRIETEPFPGTIDPESAPAFQLMMLTGDLLKFAAELTRWAEACIANNRGPSPTLN